MPTSVFRTDHIYFAGEAEAVEQQAVTVLDFDGLAQDRFDAGLSLSQSCHLRVVAGRGELEVAGLHKDGVVLQTDHDDDLFAKSANFGIATK